MNMGRQPGPGVGVGGPTQIVFLRLDPILQRLLSVVTQLKTLCDSDDGRQTGGDNYSNNNDNQILFRLIKDIVKILDELTAVIASFGRVEHQGQQNNNVFVSPLALLVDYISLPLTAIFHLKLTAMPITIQPSSTDLDTDADRYRQIQIRMAHIESLYISAAQTIRVYVEACTSQSTNTSSAPPTTTTTLKQQNLIKFLIAMTSRLPTEEREQQQDQDQLSSSSRRLADQSHMASSLLQSINTILPLCQDSQNLLDVWQGGLVMRLADCAAYLSTYGSDGGGDGDGRGRTTKSSKQSDKKKHDTTHSHENQKSSSSIIKQVHLQGLETLHLLLEKTGYIASSSLSKQPSPSSSSFWRSIFPGVFVAVYREILNIHRVASTGLVISVEEKALTVLNDLLRTVLVVATTNNDHASKEKNNPQGTKTSTDTNESILQQLTSMALTQNLATNSSQQDETAATTTPVGSNGFSAFEEKVRDRVVAPLTVVIRQESMSKSISIRRHVVALCRILLLDTRAIWRKTSLEQTPLEVCMMLQQDSEGM
jgi:hypothetical protein